MERLDNGYSNNGVTAIHILTLLMIMSASQV